jgi:hypothetical protein
LKKNCPVVGAGHQPKAGKKKTIIVTIVQQETASYIIAREKKIQRRTDLEHRMMLVCLS